MSVYRVVFSHKGKSVCRTCWADCPTDAILAVWEIYADFPTCRVDMIL